MEKEDGIRKAVKPEKEFIGDESDEDDVDLSKDEPDDKEKQDVQNIYRRACRGHQLALLDLLGQCEVISNAAFSKKMKRLYQGLNRRPAKARGEKGGRLGEGWDLLPFELYG
jgi:hypothetical protein